MNEEEFKVASNKRSRRARSGFGDDADIDFYDDDDGQEKRLVSRGPGRGMGRGPGRGMGRPRGRGGRGTGEFSIDNLLRSFNRSMYLCSGFSSSFSSSLSAKVMKFEKVEDYNIMMDIDTHHEYDLENIDHTNTRKLFDSNRQLDKNADGLREKQSDKAMDSQIGKRKHDELDVKRTENISTIDSVKPSSHPDSNATTFSTQDDKIESVTVIESQKYPQAMKSTSAYELLSGVLLLN